MKDRSQYLTVLALVWAAISFTGGVAGIADSYVEWRANFAPMIELYVGARNWLIDTFVPFPIYTWAIDYMVIGTSVAASWNFAFPVNPFIDAEEDTTGSRRFYFLWNTIIWPITLMMFGYIYTVTKNDEKTNPRPRSKYAHGMIHSSQIVRATKVLLLIYGVCIAALFVVVDAKSIGGA